MSRVLTPEPPAKPSSLKRLAALARSVPAVADLVLLGDSLAAGWPPDLLDTVVPGSRVLNFGLPGDRVQNTLWRLREVGTGHLRPRDLVLVLGTNNLGDGDPPGEIAAGLLRVIEEAHRLWSRPRTILLTVPWRAPAPSFREGDRLALNAALGRTGADVLLDADRHLSPAGEASGLLPDGLHLSPDGYRRLSAALAPLLTGP